MSKLAAPFTLKGLTLKNRIVMAPMCQYAVEAKDGKPNDWHFVHYVSRAVGGTGLIIMEMTDVEPDGRISDYDLGLWSDAHIPAFERIIQEVHKYGAKIGIQIAHAGRKAEDAPTPVGPTDIIQEGGPQFTQPHALTSDEIEAMVDKFRQAARRAVRAGVDMIELHGAHGYLLHQFHSPFINNRKDEYGQDLTRFGVKVIQAMKQEMPDDMPLFMRISAVEYVDGGYDLDHSIELCKAYKAAGVDMFHVSSGGEGSPGQRKPGNYPGFQVPFAHAIKAALQMPVVAVGMLDDPKLAEATLGNEQADLIAVGRGMLRDPYWAINAIRATGGSMEPVKPYMRGY